VSVNFNPEALLKSAYTVSPEDFDQQTYDRLSDLLIDGDGFRPVAYSAIQPLLGPTLSIWAQRNGIYGIPTLEMLDWLRKQIRGRRALEIGAGNGVFGRNLGIPMFDSFHQEDTDTRTFYEFLQTKPVSYGPDVQRMDAAEAVEKHRPQVVLGVWVTSKHREGDKIGFEGGIDEHRILSVPSVRTYITLGSAKYLNSKPIRHETPKGWSCTPHKPPFNVSRARKHADNIVLVWNRKSN
jgi:hypothetical protein